MDHSEAVRFLGLLLAILASARMVGYLAQRIGQPAVLGELVAGVLLGMSVLGLVDAHDKVLYFLAELGVVILLFEIGLETDLRKLLHVGGAAAVVAAVGVVLPFVLGYAVCIYLDWGNLVAVVVGASLTATSVGITARVLSDLGRLQDRESQVILGAAVLDDVLGLIILSIVAGLAAGQEVTPLLVAGTTAKAFGFLLGAVVLGTLLVVPLARWKPLGGLAGTTTTMLAVMFALGFAWLASLAGSAAIIGAFAAGLVLAKVPQTHQIQQGVSYLAGFFVPLFFVLVGAAVDVRVFDPTNPANRQTLLAAGLLIVAAVIGKFAAGYAPFRFHGRKSIIGAGMIPRGEVGLIFAQMGLSAAVFDAATFSAVTAMVMVTTFIAPPLLKFLMARNGRNAQSPSGLDQRQTPSETTAPGTE
jgi:Kef-type K+ transport system membrane component KefB